MGGTFDPIHVGHLLAASQAAEQVSLDEVLFVPTGQSWQKAQDVVTAAEHRVAMTALAIESDERFTLSLMEVNRSGASYTIDTVNEIRRAQPDSSIFVIVGADAARSIPTWHQSQALIDDVNFIIMSRAGHLLSGEEIPIKHATVVEMPQIEISSSDIRDRVREGRSIRFMVPDAVAAYIAKHQLYK